MPKPPWALPAGSPFSTAAMAVLLVLGATEIALSWSARTRLEDFRLESVALANTLASLLVRFAPTGNPAALDAGARRVVAPPRERVARGGLRAARRAARLRGGERRSDSGPGPRRYRALDRRAAEVLLALRRRSRLASGVAAGNPRPYGVLDVRVSTRRLQDWASQEHRRAYLLALLSALLVRSASRCITARWVGGRSPPRDCDGGRPRGAEHAPTAPEIGPPEFRELARRYNGMRDALADRERESAPAAMLLALEERARGLRPPGADA